MLKVNPDDFKDKGGRRRTISLFFETIKYQTPYEPIYTLREEDYKGFASAKRIYLEQRDPTEYRAAMALVGSWDHWQRILGNKELLPYIESWRIELEILMQSDAISILNETANGTSASAASAAKYLADKGYVKGGKAGRPTKDAIKKEAKLMHRADVEIADDMKRLGIKKVN